MKKSESSIIIMGLLILAIIPYMPVQVSAQSSDSIELRFGIDAGPRLDRGLDPHYVLDFASIAVIDQVVETLFAYDLSDPELSIIPRLAADFGNWSDDYLTYSVDLKKNIKFHDDTDFNASAVKWNFERLEHFLSLEGSEPPETPPMFSYLYLWPDGTPIIDHVDVLKDFRVIFVLTKPFVPFEALLCFSGSGIIKPDPDLQEEYIDTLEGGLVGTGPFVYDEYNIENQEVIFHAYEHYWAGEPNIDELVFSIIPNAEDRTSALIDGAIDFINTPDYSMLEELTANSEITLVDAGQSATTFYLMMNNKLIPIQMRKAISYAIDYDRIIEELLDGEAVRLRSPIPLGIPYANWDFKVPEMNIIKARQILIDSGLYGVLPAVDDDEAWENLVDNGNPIAEYNYARNWASILRQQLLIILTDNLKKIGVKLNDDLMSWDEIIDRIKERNGHNRNELNILCMGWGPDFIDPSNIINELFTNEEIASNGAQVDDKKVQIWMNEALVEHDLKKREDLYDKIQKRLIQQIYPWCWGWVSKNYDAYNTDFGGFQSNPVEKVWFYSVYVVPNNI